MEKRVEDKLKRFLDTYGTKLDEGLVRYVLDNMESFLDGKCQIDLLAQIAYAIGEKPKDGSIYEDYFKFLQREYGLEQDILEVGCGYYPAFAAMIDAHQKEKGIGSIEAYDPNLIVSEVGRIRLHNKLFETLENDRITLITSIFPCEGSLAIIDEASEKDVDYSILMCECVPQSEQWMFPFYSPDFWLRRVYTHAENTLTENRELKVDYIDHADTPIIFTKRKR